MRKSFHIKFVLFLSVVVITCAAFWFLSSPLLSQTPSAASRTPKYVFLFLADGGGMAHMEIARQYSRQILNEGFVIVDKIIKEGSVGVMTTHAANALSTDSAAAATALAGGCKANVGALGVCADGIVPVHHYRNLQFRSDTVGARDQHRILQFFKIAFKHTAKRTDI